MDNDQKGTCFMDKGTIFKFHNDLDTDQIIASQYLLLPNLEEMKEHTFESLDPDFPKKVKPGDFVVGGENFGCGSSREHAPIAIKASGIDCVIAKTFARIFYRNAINIGLPILECPEASEKIQDGDEVSIDFDSGVITNETKGETYQALPFPDFIKDIMAKGGLIAQISGKNS